MSEPVGLVSGGGPAFELICRCARVGFDAVEADRVSALIAQGIDWDQVLAAVERHYVGPLVHRSLAKLSDGAPPAVLETLRMQMLLTAWKSQQFATELVRLSKRLDAIGIDVIHYKGATAAAQYYGAVNLRNFNDLDFLVRQRDLRPLVQVLEAEGYHNPSEFNDEQFEHFVAEFKEFLFLRGEFALEPHWSITGRRYPFEVDYEAFWQRSIVIAFKDTQLRVLSPEDAMLVLCLVGAKGQWKRLQMVTDIAECLRTFPGIDWTDVAATARRTGTLRILHVGLLLAAELSGAALPAAMQSAVRSSKVTWRIARDVVARLSGPVRERRFLSDAPAMFSPLLFRQRERARDRWRYLWRTTTTPSVMHLTRMPLPRWLFPLYHVLVPVHDYLLAPAWRLLNSLVATVREPIKVD